MDDKDQFGVSLEDQLAKWKAKIDASKAQAEKKGPIFFDRYAADLEKMLGKYEKARYKLTLLRKGGSDALLVPSRFEPCGLTQLAALRYGSLPVVSRVGGLADTVVDANEMALASSAGTGIVFSPVSRETLEIAIDRTAALWRQAMVWRRVQVRAMFTDVSWTRPARRYATLYRELVAHPQP